MKKILIFLTSVIFFTGCQLGERLPYGYQYGRSLGQTDNTPFQKVLSQNEHCVIFADSSAYWLNSLPPVDLTGKTIKFISGENLSIYNFEIRYLVYQKKLLYEGYPVEGFDGCKMFHERHNEILTAKARNLCSLDDMFILVKNGNVVDMYKSSITTLIN